MFLVKKWIKLGVHDTLIITKNLINFYIQNEFKPPSKNLEERFFLILTVCNSKCFHLLGDVIT